MKENLIKEDKNSIERIKIPQNLPEISDLSIKTKERDDRLVEIREMNWSHRIFRTIEKGSLRGVIVIFIRLTLGAGIFTLPFYVKSYGYLLGFLMIVLAGGLNLWSYYNIIEASNESKSTNYFELIEFYLGNKICNFFKFSYFLDLSATVIGVFVVCYKLLQFCMGFLGIVNKDWFRDEKTAQWNEDHPMVMKIRALFFGIVFLVSIPFLLKKDLFYLQKVNYLIIFALAIMVGYVLIELPWFWVAYQGQTHRPAIKEFNVDWIENFFALLLAFYAQPYVFSLKSEMIYPTLKRMKKVTSITMGSETLLFAIVGILGYVSLGDDYTPEMFYARQPYPDKGWLSEMVYQIILVFFFGCVLLGLAIYNPTIRDYIYDTIKLDKNNKNIFITVSILPFFIYAIIAFLKPSVIFIFNFAGVSISNFNGFILPATIQAIRCKRDGKILELWFCGFKLAFLVVFGSLGMYFMLTKIEP